MACTPKPIRKYKRAFFNSLNKTTHFIVSDKNGHKILLAPITSDKIQVLRNLLDNNQATIVPLSEIESIINFDYMVIDEIPRRTP